MRLLLSLATAGALLASASPAHADYADTINSTPSLKSYWRLGETAGTTAADVRNVRAGTYVNGVRLGGPGAPAETANPSVTFDGSNDHVTFGDAYDHAGNAAFTIEGWIKPATTGSATTWRRIASKETSAGGYALQIYPDSAGTTHAQRALFTRTSNGATDSVRSVSPLKPGIWHHVAVTYDATMLRLYLNGRLEGTTSATVSLPGTTAALRLGSHSSGGGAYGGGIDDFAVYGSALPASVIQSHHAAGTAPAPAPAPETTSAPDPTPAPTAITLLTDTFSGVDGVITSSAEFWGSGSNSPLWEGESGTMYRRSSTAWTNSPVFRFWTKRSDFTNVRVEMDVKTNAFINAYRDWDGVKIWLRRQVINGSSSANVKPGLYVAEVHRRAGNVILQKKCAGRDDYTVLGNTSWSGNPNPVTYGASERVGATVRTNADGSVTLELIRKGSVVLTATDRGGNGCAPITTPAKVGVRADNADFNFDNFVVTPL
jgi:hypothetical protein